MKKKFYIILVALAVLLGYGIFKIQKFGFKGYFHQLSVMSQEKKVKKEIERKIYSKEFNDIVSKVDLKGLNTVNYLTDRDSVRISLNDNNAVEELKKISSPDIAVKDAELILVTSRELTELQKVSEELKGYLKKRYKDFDYEYFGSTGDKMISFIREREKMDILLPKEFRGAINNLTITKAEQVKDILKGKPLPDTLAFSEEDFFKNRLTYINMRDIYEISCTIEKLVDLVPELRPIVEKKYLNIDIKSIARDGQFYLSDKKVNEIIEEEYLSGEYTFENPYLKINPYNRVKNSVLIKYPGVEKDNITVTVSGRNSNKDISYKVIKAKEIEVLGLYIGGEANIITINNGKKEVKIPVTIGELANDMPSIITTKLKENSSSKESSSPKDMLYTTYLYNNKTYGIIFDRDGYIRYLFNPNNPDNVDDIDAEPRYLKYEKNGFTYYTKNSVIVFSKFGKIMNRLSMEEFNKKNDALPFLDAGYPEFTAKKTLEKNAIVNTKNFTNVTYPLGKIVELNPDNGSVIFSAEIYFDYNDRTKNSINSSEEVEFPN